MRFASLVYCSTALAIACKVCRDNCREENADSKLNSPRTTLGWLPAAVSDGSTVHSRHLGPRLALRGDSLIKLAGYAASFNPNIIYVPTLTRTLLACVV